MPAREEARLTTLLWRAAADADQPLDQIEIDRILELEARPARRTLPQQRQEPDPEAWSRIRTDAGDQKWLNHLFDRHRREQS